MDNPACSTVDVPSIHKTDHTNTSLFDESELELQCYHNEGVIVDDEENTADKTDADDPEVSKLDVVYSEAVLNIMQSSPSWKNKDNSNNSINMENEDHDNDDDGCDTLKIEDNCRVSDGESCSSNSSSCLTFSEHYIKVLFY